MLPLAIGLASNVPITTPRAVPAVARVARMTAGDIGSCTLPFDPIKQIHAIDSSCGAIGTASTDPQAAQNTAKNNFCAPGPAVNLNFSNFAQLQQAAQDAGVPFGSSFHLPPDRSVLQNILTLPNQTTVGEGSVVRLAAFIIDAHYSNVRNGESVNCQTPGNENNDIHIVLGQNSNQDDPCTSVTAEISPHFRPDVWNTDNLNQNNAHLFRFTGQLFFDAAHKPCVGGTGPNPQRVAIWEIHPVYAVDICIDPNNACTVDNDQNWQALSDFIGAPPPSTETRLLLSDPITREFSRKWAPRL
jgi:hypothetical protein